MPDPVDAAKIVESAGADGITVHLREDRRHINDKDVENLKKSIRTKLNLEMSIAPDIVEVAKRIVPQNVCLVPEKRQELTTEGGLNIVSNTKKTENVVKDLKDKKIVVSIFIDPDFEQIKTAKRIGADFVELHTGRYAESNEKMRGFIPTVAPDFNRGGMPKPEASHNIVAEVLTSENDELKKIKDVSQYALELGLGLNAGHGLDYENVREIAKIKGMNELNIGYSIICRALFVGLFQAVKEMKNILKQIGDRR